MFACIFIPDFSVQAIIRFEPELRASSVAVLTGRPPLEKVVALNERARQTGVEIGATKPQLEAWENLALRTRCAARLCAIVFSGSGRHLARHCASKSCRSRAVARSAAEDCPRFGAAGFADGTGGEPCRGRKSGCRLTRSPRFSRRHFDS